MIAICLLVLVVVSYWIGYGVGRESALSEGWHTDVEDGTPLDGAATDIRSRRDLGG